MLKHLLSYKLAAYFTIILSIFLSTSHAVEVEGLYVVSSPVKAQSKSVLRKASLSGFKEVLIRNSGSNAILQDKSVNKAYRKVTDYLQRFEYSKQEIANAPISTIENKDLSPYIITLYFEPRLINELIQGAQMSLWGASRPLTAIWLVIEENNKRKVVNEASDLNDSEINYLVETPIKKIILDNAQRRGLPVLFPLMDLEDELLVSISDIWGLFSTSINMASLRYSADSSLFGRIRQDGVLWVGKFGFINQKSEINFDLISESKETLIADMINKLSELLCEKYCVVEDFEQKNEVYLDINNINSFKKFKVVESYLDSLSSIRQFELIEIDSTHIILKLTLLGKVESLADDIKLSQKMLLINEAVEHQINTPSDEQLNELQNTQVNSEYNSTNVNSIENKKEITTIYYRWVG